METQTVATFKLQTQYQRVLSPRIVSHLVATDGSLFLILGLLVSKDSKSQSYNTTDTSNNIQNVHIGYLLESDSREAAIFAFLSALAGSQATVPLTANCL